MAGRNLGLEYKTAICPEYLDILNTKISWNEKSQYPKYFFWSNLFTNIYEKYFCGTLVTSDWPSSTRHMSRAAQLSFFNRKTFISCAEMALKRWKNYPGWIKPFSSMNHHHPPPHRHHCDGWDTKLWPHHFFNHWPKPWSLSQVSTNCQYDRPPIRGQLVHHPNYNHPPPHHHHPHPHYHHRHQWLTASKISSP